MSRLRVRAVPLVATAAVACGMPLWNPPPPRPWTPPPLSTEPGTPGDGTEYGVQRWLLRRVAGKARVVLVRETTLECPPHSIKVETSGWPFDLFLDTLARTDSPLVANYLQQCRTPVRLEVDSLTTGMPVVLLSDSAIRSRDWRPIYRQHRGASGILGISRVGFNQDTTRALVQVLSLCGPALCGGVQQFFLARAPGASWTVWRDDWVMSF